MKFASVRDTERSKRDGTGPTPRRPPRGPAAGRAGIPARGGDGAPRRRPFWSDELVHELSQDKLVLCAAKISKLPILDKPVFWVRIVTTLCNMFVLKFCSEIRLVRSLQYYNIFCGVGSESRLLAAPLSRRNAAGSGGGAFNINYA